MYLPEYYEFCCRVKIVAGMDALERIPSLLRDMGACRPMVITDKGVRTAGLVDLLVKVVGNGMSIATLSWKP